MHRAEANHPWMKLWYRDTESVSFNHIKKYWENQGSLTLIEDPTSLCTSKYSIDMA